MYFVTFTFQHCFEYKNNDTAGIIKAIFSEPKDASTHDLIRYGESLSIPQANDVAILRKESTQFQLCEAEEDASGQEQQVNSSCSVR